jgi:hypothetical protein
MDKIVIRTLEEWESRRQHAVGMLRRRSLPAEWERSRQKSCVLKVRFLSASLAAVAAQDFMMRLEIPRMTAYRCVYCGDWHLSAQVRLEESTPYMVLIDKAHVPTLKSIRQRRDEVKLSHIKKRQERYVAKPAKGKRPKQRFLPEEKEDDV